MKIFYCLSITFILTLLVLRLTTVTKDNSYPQVLIFDNTERATVKIITTRKDGRRSGGTGTVFRVDDKSIYILTAGHVVRNHQSFSENADRVSVQFFSDGRRLSTPFYVKVLWYKYEVATVDESKKDVAVLKISKSILNTFGVKIPTFIPLAKDKDIIPEKAFSKNDTSRMDNHVAACSCPGSYYPKCWLGYILEIDDEIIRFTPNPGYGSSGSAILTREQDKILGVLCWWHTSEVASGITVKKIRELCPKEHRSLFDD